MPDKANFTRAEASVQLALVKKGDYIDCVADGFVCHARKSNQLGRLVISQRKFQPDKHYCFYWCGFRLWLVKEEIRQLLAWTYPLLHEPQPDPPPPPPPRKKDIYAG